MRRATYTALLRLLLPAAVARLYWRGLRAPASRQRVAERLNLSPEEINQLDTAFIDSRKKMIELKGRMEIEQLELETLIENPALDEPAAMNQYQKLEKARMDLGMERFRFLISVRKIIGYEKFQELMEMKKNRDRGRNNR